MKGLTERIWRPSLARSSFVISFLVLLVIGVIFSSRFFDPSISFLAQNSVAKFSSNTLTFPEFPKISKVAHTRSEFPLNCSLGNHTRTCPATYYPSKFTNENVDESPPPPSTCPDYFRWIHNDLWPWKETGITEDMVRAANKTANFRLVIVNGTAYVEKYRRAFQSRDRFTLWGILQLLRKYPGKVPDLDLMFDCSDRPVIKTESYQGSNSSAPPPLFSYCGDDTTLDIAFPDWSFWGWPEINIKPWEGLSKDLKEGNKIIKWSDREPHAYWKGNPMVSKTRRELFMCNVSKKHDWGAHLFTQDWIREREQGFKQSDLASQCNYRFKIYIEGTAWSVSEKYILACDSLTLVVKPRYYDFFTRSLMPLEHYWPIKDDDKCRSIKHAVDWGNQHTDEAKAIGRAGSRFIQKEVNIEYVYDYMFHVLSEYAKMMKYKPTVPHNAVELCSESMACPDLGLEKKFMEDSLVKGPTNANPCTMAPPYDLETLHLILEKRKNYVKHVEMMEKEYWDNQNNQKIG